ncbi:MAG TPA: hypothetical protein VK508_00665 [Cyclobacteriaceae bacterium]|nr:hypothetical protein [Cyclobacteriaceae bacterium]
MGRHKSYENFKNDLENIFSTIVSLQHYSLVGEVLFFNKDKLKLTTEEDVKVFKDIHAFEHVNYINNSLFIALIALLESYLQDRLIEELESNEGKVQQLIRKYSIDRKLTPDDVIKGPRSLANEIIEGTIFHNLPVVNALYKNVFNTDILGLMKDKEIFLLIKIRHKIVHHSGRVAEKRIKIREMGILEAMNSISRWIENIEFYLSNKKERKTFPNYVRRYFKDAGYKNSKIYEQGMPQLAGRWLVNMDNNIKNKGIDQHIYWK